MKKFLFFSLFLIGYITSAQFTFQNEETGNLINDGDIITISTDSYTTNFIATNNYTSNIHLSLEVVDITNTDGSEMSICFGVLGGGGCSFPIHVGDVYNGGNALPPGAQTNSGDIHFQHHDNTNIPTYPKDYLIKVSALNADHGDAFLSSITFTYRYDPSAGIIGELTQADFQLISLSGALKIQNTYPTNLQIFNLTGQSVLQTKLEKGNHSLSTGNLQKGIYIVHAQANGRETFQKIIIK